MFKKFPESGRLGAAWNYLIYKKFAQCIGIASLVLVTNYGQFLGGGSDARMHTPVPLTAICMAQITDILLVTGLLFALLMGLRRTRFYLWARLVLAILIPPYLIERSQSLFPVGTVEGYVIVMTVIWAALLLLLLLRFPVWYRRSMRIASWGCAACALFALSSIGQLIWVASWRPGPHIKTAVWSAYGQPKSSQPAAAQPPRQHKRIVWILFDELSYQQVFERRARDLPMPNFDALKAQSTIFTNVQPVGYKTVKIIPSLFSNQRIDDFHYSVKNRFWLHEDGGSVRAWRRLTGSGTIFADAQQRGWRTSVVGWYNPYCTIYGDALDDCYWTNQDRFDGPHLPQRQLLAQRLHPPPPDGPRDPLARKVRPRPLHLRRPQPLQNSHRPDEPHHADAQGPIRETSPSSTSASRTAPTSGAGSTTTSPPSATAPTWTTWRWWTGRWAR